MKIKKTTKPVARRSTASTSSRLTSTHREESVATTASDSGTGDSQSHSSGRTAQTSSVARLQSVRTPHTARALKAWKTRRSAWYRGGRTERASKAALADWCIRHGWKVTFFEGKSGAPRTGVVDAVLVRITPGQADSIEIRLVQLKAGAGGLTASEVKRIKAAASQVITSWVLAAFDGTELHFVPDVGGPNNGAIEKRRKKSYGA